MIDNDTQNKRLAIILEELKNKGFSQRQIIDTLDLDFITDETYLSNLKSGKRKTIRPELIEGLNSKFNVNPDYLRLESDIPFDTMEIKFENFIKFVDDWNVLERANDKYLHITIDMNFYNFLIETNRAKEITDEGYSTFEKEKQDLKELHSGTPKPTEFVLIPRNFFVEIVESELQKTKYLSEVLDFSEFTSYIKEE